MIRLDKNLNTARYGPTKIAMEQGRTATERGHEAEWTAQSGRCAEAAAHISYQGAVAACAGDAFQGGQGLRTGAGE